MTRHTGAPGGGGRPGGPSAKTFHRAGSPNRQDDSKEIPILTPFPLVGGAR